MKKNKISAIPLGIRSAVVFLFATLFSRGLAIITTPIFTRLMTTEEIGEVNLFSSWYSMLGVIATLSLTSGGFTIALKEFKEERNQYVSSVLSLTSLIAILFSIVYFIKPSFWNNVTGLSSKLMLLMLFGFFVAPARDFWLSRQRYEYKYKLPGIITICSAIIASTLSIFVVIKMNSAKSQHIAEGRLFANYIIVFGVALAIWIATIGRGKTFFNKRFWSFSLKLSLPLVGYSIASQILNTSDRLMIGKLVNNSAVGIYSTLYTVSSLSIIIWSALNSSFEPYLYQNMENKHHRIKEISLGMLGLYGVIAVMLVFCAPEIVRILATEEYYEAIYIMPPIAAGVFFTSVSNMYSNILVYLKKTKYIMISSVIAAILNVVLNALFIPKLGYMAAAYTTLVSYIVMAGILMFCAYQEYRKRIGSLNKVYDNNKIIILSLGVVSASLSGLLTYKFVILRYISIIGMFAVGLILLKKFVANKKTMK